ncbi:MAG: bifunctional alpha/beta hydrolase/class I SAM-dependent methyltransferase [Burkholderiales bacterium]
MQRPVREATFRTHDGVDLFYRHWPATEGPARGALVLFHRGHEHSGRMAHLPDELSLPEFDCFAWDQRGHGRSPGARGDAPSFMTLVRDVQDFVDHLRDAHGFAGADLAIVAQSVGAVLVATWVHDYAPRPRCMVLASPAFDVKLYVPFARPGLALMQKLRGNFFVTSYVKSRFLTRDVARSASYDRDPLIARAISVRILLGLYEAAERVVADAQAIVVPTQLLVSGADWVVRHAPQHAFFDRLGAPVKERHVLHGFLHDTLGEAQRGTALARVRSFIERRFAQPCATPMLTDADEGGATREEADALAAPLPALSPRGLYWAATRAGLRIGGLLSDGVRLGHETGFDSGATLDYVYRHKPSGRMPLGRAIDRTYLESIGWRGIRQRKRHLEALLQLAIANHRAAGVPVHVVDVAAGHGRYVLDALDAEALPDSILLRDYDERNVAQCNALIAARGLQRIARSERGDAFARDTLAALAPAPTITIVSGLFELFPGNDAPRACLAGLADSMPADALLLYTGQPWHPQLELIARALTSHRGGQAWVMRRRTQAELDALVRAAGFEKVTQRIDEWGIFTVSLARRVRRG